MTVLNKLKNSTANVNNKFAIKKYTPERIAGKENIKLLVQRTPCWLVSFVSKQQTLRWGA